MTSFIHMRIRARNQRPSKRSSIDSCPGFTLIELLEAIAVIASLIALLLPVIQQRREEYAKNKATQNITSLMVASNEYFRRIGSFPNSISDLFQFCSANPGACSLDPQLATGRAGGYNIILANTEGDIHIMAEPEFPGITGSITVIIDVDFGLTTTETLGADEARQRAFDKILAKGAETAVRLLNLDSTGFARSQVRDNVGASTVNADTLASVFDTLDTTEDARVSLEESVTGQGSGDPVPTEVNSFLTTVFQELKLDSLSTHDRQAISVTMAELDTTHPSLFSFDELQHLTRVHVNLGEGDDILAAKLQAAEDAEASGNRKLMIKALNEYKKRVKNLRGTSVTRFNANTLITLAEVLIA